MRVLPGGGDPPDFTSAGGHFNPANRKHGLKNADGPHAGDLPNLEVPPAGSGRYETLAGVSLVSGLGLLFDADGSALVVHAAADDDVTDPAGNSGARIACGEITRAAGAAGPAPQAAPAQVPRALPRTGDLGGASLALSGLAAGLLATGLALRRRSG